MSEVISWKNAEHRNLDAYSGVEMGDESHLTRVEDVEALVALQAEEEGITDPVVTGHTYVRRTKHIYFGRGTEEAEGSSNCGTCDGGDCGSCKVLTYLTLRVRSAAVIAEEEAQHLRIRQEYEATHTKVECFLRDGKPVIREGKPQTRWIHNRDMREVHLPARRALRDRDVPRERGPDPRGGVGLGGRGCRRGDAHARAGAARRHLHPREQHERLRVRADARGRIAQGALQGLLAGPVARAHEARPQAVDAPVVARRRGAVSVVVTRCDVLAALAAWLARLPPGSFFAYSQGFAAPSLRSTPFTCSAFHPAARNSIERRTIQVISR